MSKEVSFKNHDRFIQLGVAISSLRDIRGLSQEKLAEKAGISRSLFSVIEAPNTAHCFSMEVFYRMVRKFTKSKAVFPTDDSIKKVIFMSFIAIS